MSSVHPSLSSAEAAQRLRADGPNELPSGRSASLVQLALGVLRQPMLLLLVIAVAIYGTLGEAVEAGLLAVSILVIIGIELYQEVTTERSLEALRDLASPRALVIRDGAYLRIPGREVVAGDLAVLESGDRIPADGEIVESTNLSVDESLLTGESLPVAKSAKAAGKVYSGTLVTEGQGLARITATGVRTELGKIGAALGELEVQRTPLQREIDRVVAVIGRAAIIICLLVAAGYGFAQASWVAGLLAGISVAMSMIPEEFPIVLTAFLALGAARIARNEVLTRRVAAIETLGATTVLCSDKTGTLTLNRMAVARVCTPDGEIRSTEGAPGDDDIGLLSTALRASRPAATDPVDRAIHELADTWGAQAPDGAELLREYSLSAELPAMSNVWRIPGSSALTLAAKGAPEAIADLCHLATDARRELDERVQQLASQGFRVLAVASGAWGAARPLPEAQHDLTLQWEGLLGFADPIRPEVPAAIHECEQAGIRVVMITGDHRETARQIAYQIGLDHSDRVLTGAELQALTSEALAERVANTNVFVRVAPEQKLRIVRALESRGEVVAMTGDGVNDAPALKAAHIGIAMGRRGTDVAREAAPLVLLDDNFASIVRAIRAGRRIYDNLRKSMTFLLAVHVPIAGLSLVPALAGWPLILLPAHIVLLELIVDPVCSLVFEQEPDEPNIMQRPPRDPSTPLFTRELVSTALLQGSVVLAVTLAVVLFGWSQGADTAHVRSITFGTLVVALLGVILSNRSLTLPMYRSIQRPNRLMLWTMLGVPAALMAVLTVPPLAALFRFSPVDASGLGLILACGLSTWLLLELVEIGSRRLGRG